jgi:hypothetical protein
MQGPERPAGAAIVVRRLRLLETMGGIEKRPGADPLFGRLDPLQARGHQLIGTELPRDDCGGGLHEAQVTLLHGHIRTTRRSPSVQ